MRAGPRRARGSTPSWRRNLVALAIDATDGGPATGRAAAAAAIAARRLDNGTPVTTYGAVLNPTTNPGVGLWRQSNAAPVFVNLATGAPTGFDATAALIQGRLAPISTSAT